MPSVTEYAFGRFRLLPAGRLLLHDDQPVRLGARAFDLLHVLVRHAGTPVPKEVLLAEVWAGTVVDDGSVRVHMAALRKALGDDAARPRFIANVPQRGYSFVAAVTGHDGSAAVPVEPPAHPIARPPAPSSAPSTPPGPPAPRLVGRDDVVAAVTEQLERHRLVTLVGPGGIGKTSVALDVMARAHGQHRHGTCFVDLSSLTDAALVPSTLAAALQVPVLGEDALDRVIAQLQGRELLVVLDNCEHVIDAAAQLAESLLRRVPGVRVLATSREALRAQGEWIQRLNGLATPSGDHDWRADEALAFPAIQLLVERVAAGIDGFTLGDADANAAVHIGRALDGIPLAIELAAAHVPSFGLQHLVTLLSGRLTLLAQGRRSILARHQTLQATLDWSHGLLDEREQAVLRRLSIFRGPFAIEAAVAMGQCPRIDAAGAADCLGGLVNKSMVTLDPGTEGDAPSYRLLETTRGYAQQRLADSGEWAGIARRHARMVDDTLRHLDATPGQRIALRIDDVRAALDWAMAAGGDPSLGVGLTVASAALWFKLGLVKEFRDRLDQADAMRQRLPEDPVRDVHLSLARGHAYLHTLGPTDISDASLRRALAGALRVGQPGDRLSALWSLYAERMVRGDYAATLALAQQFGEVSDAAGSGHSRFTHHRMMAMSLHMTGRHDPALEHARQALRAPDVRAPYLHGTAYQVDHRASSMAPLARILWLQGRSDDAAGVVAEAVERATAVDHGFSSTFTLALAACPVAFWRGDLDSARRYTAMLQDCAARHTLAFWGAWGRMYAQVLAWWPDRSAGALGWLPEFAAHAGRCDMLGTLAGDLLHANAVRRVDAGLNRWCAVELRRARIEQEWRAGQRDAGDAIPALADCVRDAQAEGALAWELRATTTLAEALHATGRTADAVVRLGDVLARVPQGRGTGDPLRAEALLAGWTA